MPSSHDDLVRLLRDLARAHRQLVRLTERLAAECGATLTPDVAPHAAPQTAADGARQLELSELDTAILQLLERSGPLKGLVVARRLGRDYSYVRKRLRILVELTLIRHVTGGYERAPGEAPR